MSVDEVALIMINATPVPPDSLHYPELKNTQGPQGIASITH